ncbi:alkaline phosphatase, partial [Pseudomonas aeruginosa]|nr:alkaline phosphatase [Pseudomonas aeruginosa]
VAVLLGGQHLEIHRIERDKELIARLIELERDFWNYVQRDTPPPADGSDSAEQALRCLYPEDHGHILDFTQDPVLSAAFDELQMVRASLEVQGKRKAELKQQLQQAMGEASRALFANGAVSWRKAKDSVVLDVSRLLKEKPYLLARYPTTKVGSRRFLIT